MKERIKLYVKSHRWAFRAFVLWSRLGEILRPCISGSHNKVVRGGVLRAVKFDVVGDQNTFKFGARSIVSKTKIYVRGNGNSLIVEDGVIFNGGALRFEGDGCSIRLGANTTVSSASIEAVESNRSIDVGCDCMFSLGISIWTSDFHSIVDPTDGRTLNPGRNVRIGDHVWVGAYATILKGVDVGHGSVVGARAVVVSDVAPGSVVSGSPARELKHGIGWSRYRPDLQMSRMSDPGASESLK